MEFTDEIHFAQKLASNQPKIREKTLKKVGAWLERMSASSGSLTEDGLLKLWKGLFYYFWHCDKPLFQEDRAAVLSKYIHVFKSMEGSLLYIDIFFQTMAREWFTIDHYRLEKFMMLVRKFLRECFELLKLQKWDIQCIRSFSKVLKKTVLGVSEDSAPVSLKTHVSDIYMEELAKVGSEELTPEIIQQFLIPYCNILYRSNDYLFVSCVRKEVFLYLINQEVDEREFNEFPVLKFDPESIQQLVLKYANKQGIRRKNMKALHFIVKRFEDFKNGVDLAEKIFNQDKGRKLRKRAIEQASVKLLEEEDTVSRENMEFKTNKKKRKLNDI